MKKVADVFPTCVGVNRHAWENEACCDCIPHVCGGEPFEAILFLLSTTYSPRVWG